MHGTAGRYWFGRCAVQATSATFLRRLQLDAPITDNADARSRTRVRTWPASGGWRFPEASIAALYHLATDSDVGWRDGVEPYHRPVRRRSRPRPERRSHAYASDRSPERVELDVRYLGHQRRCARPGTEREFDDDRSRELQLANATGGLVLAASGDVSGAILEGSRACRATVTPTTESGTCHPALDISWRSAATATAGSQCSGWTATAPRRSTGLSRDRDPGATSHVRGDVRHRQRRIPASSRYVETI